MLRVQKIFTVLQIILSSKSTGDRNMTEYAVLTSTMTELSALISSLSTIFNQLDIDYDDNNLSDNYESSSFEEFIEKSGT